ncbi:hypothetical protein PHMEG_00015872 [Phytophthora megakarya]|uniref:Uncharacterized protein n=1 Tax=Phytophthora megakarya TaxID=4795 RepID=A0A225W0N7_9STRA|nr:hypothetical protein PHMEG_00015872 [Phytophthora megakarya]
MARDWTLQPLGLAIPDELQKLYALATADYPLHDDSALRQMTALELDALDAYMTGRLDLPAPPTFLTCTMSTLKRLAILKFHKEHIEATLIAFVEAKIRLGKHITRQAILRELLAANGGPTQGDKMVKRLMGEALRIVFDGRNTLSFVFASKRAAKPWIGAALKFRTGVLQLHESSLAKPGVQAPPQVAQQYAVRVLGVAVLDPVELLTIFNRATSDNVLDIRQRGMDGLNTVDNDYWTVIFRGLDCPPALRDGTDPASLSTNGTNSLQKMFTIWTRTITVRS